jgi:hypothetical protein
MTNTQKWDYSLGLIQVDGLTPSEVSLLNEGMDERYRHCGDDCITGNDVYKTYDSKRKLNAADSLRQQLLIS